MATAHPKSCAFCGTRPGTTRDHVPPKGIFPKPRPRLITVPACPECNNGASVFERRFRAYLSLHAGIDDPTANRLWQNHALPRLLKDDKLRRKILSQAEPIWLTTQQGIIFDRGYRFLWDSQAHDAVIERTVRGLYFHHVGSILGDAATIRVHWFAGLSDSLFEGTADWHQVSVGGGQFVYRFAVAKDDPLHSAWLFQFFQRHWAGGYTEPADPSHTSLSSDVLARSQAATV